MDVPEIAKKCNASRTQHGAEYSVFQTIMTLSSVMLQQCCSMFTGPPSQRM
jgi:hypothetical protein